MIKVADKIWIGDSDDEQGTNIKMLGIDAILNVAYDLKCSRGWKEKIEYMQVGLIDGPGNLPITYVSAILALISLVDKHNVLVCCHNGGRSLAVVIMYLILIRGKISDHPTFLNYWTAWDILLEELTNKIPDLPTIHNSHKEVFNKLPLGLIESLL